MNIAIFTPTITAGGAEKQAVILASCMAANHHVSFFVFWGDLPKEQKHIKALNESGVELISLKGSTFKKIIILTRLIKDKKIEVAFNFLTICDGVCCFAEKIAGIQKIFNNIRSSRLPWWKETIERFCSNHWATKTIFNSYCGAEYFGSRGFSDNKLIVIHNCFQKIDSFHERAEKEAITIITVGRFDSAKDYETSIKAVANARLCCPSIHYKIVGHGALETSVRKWVSQYGIQDITEILINPSNIPDLLMDADIFLMTSVYEGTSNAVMEALNASLPVVCTNVGDNAFLVKDGVNGFVHTVADVNSISSSLIKLIQDYSLRILFGRNGNKNLKENFSEKSFTQQYLSLMEN